MQMKKIICFVNKEADLEVNQIKKKYKNVKCVKVNNNKKILNYIASDSLFFISKNLDELTKKKLIIELLSKEKTFYIELSFIDMLKLDKNKINCIGDIPTIKVKKLELTIYQKFLKRIFDIIFSLFAIAIFMPFYIIVPIFIKFDSKGPVFYKQKRLTLNNKEFIMYKFRSMINDAELKSGPVMACVSDPRITKVGSILRKFKIDELPQFFNVLKGDMSIVGPRPERKYFMDILKKDIPEYKLRLKVKAGITCFAHVYGNYHTSLKKRLEYDILYMHKWNIFKDFKMLFLTLKKILIGSGK